MGDPTTAIARFNLHWRFERYMYEVLIILTQNSELILLHLFVELFRKE